MRAPIRIRVTVGDDDDSTDLILTEDAYGQPEIRLESDAVASRDRSVTIYPIGFIVPTAGELPAALGITLTVEEAAHG